MKIIDEVKLDYQDVLIRPKSSRAASRKHINLVRKIEKFPNSSRSLEVVPIMAANMNTTGTFAMANALHKHRWITCLHKYYGENNIEDFFRNYGMSGRSSHMNNIVQCAWLSIGMSENDFNRICNFVSRMDGLNPNICIDVANGYTDNFVSFVSRIREICPDSIIMAGNVATPEMVERLIRQGCADIIKVGIGPGSVCTTRLVTGVGYPQLSAVLECADAAHGSSHGYICADGGCTASGDVCKAFGANADFVMLGGMLAGVEECEGEWEYTKARCCCKKHMKETHPKQKISLKYYGMSSYSAHDKHDGHKDYRASEGKAVRIPYKGPVEGVVKQVEGGIRSCCAYIGAEQIKHMGRCTTFVKVNRTHNAIFENGNEYSSEEIRSPTGSN